MVLRWEEKDAREEQRDDFPWYKVIIVLRERYLGVVGKKREKKERRAEDGDDKNVTKVF